MRALSQPVVNSAVALLLLGFAMQAAAEAPTGKTADTQEVPSQTAPVQQEPQQAVAPETQSVHIQVGRSIVVNTQARLRRLVVSNPSVLDTVTVSTTQVVVTAKAPGSSSLVMWDESAKARILDVYADVDVSALREGVRTAFPAEPVEIEAEQGRVLVSGKVSNKAIADDILKMASVYSKDVVSSLVLNPPHEKQVMLKVQFAEVDRVKLDQFGINILSTGAANTIGTISTQQFSPFSLGTDGKITGVIGAHATGTTTTISANDLLNIFIFRPDLNLGATIKALQQKNVLQILAQPNLMARSGEPAKFLAGGEFPFPVVQGGTNYSSVTIQFKPFGVRLDFTGVIDGDKIRLKVAPEVSALDFTNAVTISGFVVPALSTRRAETEVELRDGQSFGIAGLIDKRTTVQMSKVPGFGDIPVLGNLFRSRSFNRTNTELLVLVTPQIVDPVSQAAVVPPAVPQMPVRNLDTQGFDRGMDQKPSPSTSTTSK